jgi:hypothetical protein
VTGRPAGPGEVARTYPLDGTIAALAAAIAAGTGGPGGLTGGPAGLAALAAALAAAFPGLPAPDGIEGCTSHPALTARFRVPGLGRESVKLVLVPRPGGLEARVRAEVPGGSYRKETLHRIAARLEAVEEALGRPRAP